VLLLGRGVLRSAETRGQDDVDTPGQQPAKPELLGEVVIEPPIMGLVATTHVPPGTNTSTFLGRIRISPATNAPGQVDAPTSDVQDPN